MGTRHLIAVQVDGEYKLAQYGQWDGYPKEKGRRVLEFLHELKKRKTGLEQFKSKCSDLKFLSTGAVYKLTKAAGDDWPTKLPSLSRDTSADILTMVLEASKPVPVFNQIAFAGESLLCEWCYVIDFDAEKLEDFPTFEW